MSNLNLQGIWLPIEILTDQRLSDKEKYLCSMIGHLSRKKGYCYCTNKTVSEVLNVSITQVSKLINSLKDKGYIEIEFVYKENSKQIEMRKLLPKITYNIPYLTKVQYPVKQNFNTPIEEKFKDNKNNNNKIIDNIGKQNRKIINMRGEERDYTDFDFTKIYANKMY